MLSRILPVASWWLLSTLSQRGRPPAARARLTDPNRSVAKAPRDGTQSPCRREPTGILPKLAGPPAEAANRAVPRHWEGDLIVGKLGRSAIGVFVERRSRYVLLLHVQGGRIAPLVRPALVERMVTLLG